jgi:hypothetical protein
MVLWPIFGLWPPPCQSFHAAEFVRVK